MFSFPIQGTNRKSNRKLHELPPTTSSYSATIASFASGSASEPRSRSGSIPLNHPLPLTIFGDHVAYEVRKTMTTGAGRPVGDNQSPLTVDLRDPVVC